MSLPSLLSRMSRRTPRFVTVNGRVVSGEDSIVATATGYQHREHGPVTPVRRHTNHGGKPPDEIDQTPWWDQNPTILDDERETMARAFPGFIASEVDGRPAWRGEIDTGRGKFAVTVVHRPDRGLPNVIPVKPGVFRRHEGRHTRFSPHLYLNGNLCVASQDDWDPDRDDATTVIAWTAHWLAAFTEWRFTGRWPCDGVEFDAA